MKSQIVHHQHGGMSFNGADAVNVYRAKVIASALRFYAKTGMKVNRAYTPTAMIKAANEMTGHVYRRGQYEAAAAALDELAARSIGDTVEVVDNR
jgi:hypothetical protein